MSKQKDLTGHELRRLKPFILEETLAKRGYRNLQQTLKDLCEFGILDKVGDGCYHNVLAGQLSLTDAIRSVVRVPLYGHVSCLHDFGIITQIPQSMDIYVIDQPTVRHIDGVNMIHKSGKWLEDKVKRGGIMRPCDEKPWRSPHSSLPSLHPQFVYEDMVKTGNMEGLDPDDFDWGFVDEKEDFVFVLPVPEYSSTFDI